MTVLRRERNSGPALYVTMSSFTIPADMSKSFERPEQESAVEGVRISCLDKCGGEYYLRSPRSHYRLLTPNECTDENMYCPLNLDETAEAHKFSSPVSTSITNILPDRSSTFWDDAKLQVEEAIFSSTITLLSSREPRLVHATQIVHSTPPASESDKSCTRAAQSISSQQTKVLAVSNTSCFEKNQTRTAASTLEGCKPETAPPAPTVTKNTSLVTAPLVKTVTKKTRITRGTRGSAPRNGRSIEHNKSCHICWKPQRRHENETYAICANVTVGRCRKVLCERCFLAYSQYGDWTFDAACRSSGWFCPHCTGVSCPRYAQCVRAK